MRAKQMANLPKATRRNYNSVCNLLSNDGPIVESEANVYMNDLDCAALIEHDESKAVDGFIEDVLALMPCQRATRVSETPLQSYRSMTEHPIVLVLER